jgi:hypothetical protein
MNLKMKKCATLCLVFFIAAVLAPVTGWSENQQQQGMGEDVGQIEVSDQEVITFAIAQQEVIAIQQDYSTQIAQVEDVDKQKEIVQEANQKMVEAVQGAGFSVERYNMILNAAQSNNALQQRIISATQQLQ